jgi:hypothetical protein
MKITLFATMVALMILTYSLSTATTEVSGFIKSDVRLMVSEDELPLYDIYNTLRLEVYAPLSNRLSTFSSLDLRNHYFSRGKNLNDLGKRDKIDPVDFGVWEAYVDLFGFPLASLDMRVGKQRIAWGTADRLNPTDNLNPDDFSDPLDFGRKLPSMALNAMYYFGDYTLTLIWLPSLRPALFPETEFTPSQEMLALPLPSGLTIASMEEDLLQPEPLLKNSMFAAKFGGTLLSVDWSISYFRGFDDIPIATSVTAVPESATSLKVTSELSFPKLHVIGADFASEFFSIGFWGETAVVVPDKESLLISVTVPGVLPQTEKQTILENEVYVKYTIGVDYTFRGGIYINMQFAHGFFHEIGRENLQDYIVARMEKDFFDEKLQAALYGGVDISDFDDIKNNIGYFITPELILKPADSIEITLGIFFLDGKESTLFGQWKDLDQVYLKFKVDF